jgi:hypothetical protein
VRSVALAGLVFAIFGAAALACSSFGADGGGTPSATDAGDVDATTTSDDAATTDAATTDAADGGPPPTNLLVNGDFENGCNSWAPYQATLTGTPSGRDGGNACRICTNHALTLLFSVNQTPVGAPAPGSTYSAEVWVRGVPAPASSGNTTVGDTAYATFRTREAPSATNTEYVEQGLLLKAEWQKVAVKLAVAKPAAMIDFYVYIEREGGAPTSTCFEVDDATVFKTP